MSRIIRVTVLLLVVVSTPAFTQVVSSQNVHHIVELEMVQSPVTNTFVSISMKRIGHLNTNGEQVVIHRSVDNTASWTAIDTFFPGPDSRLIDPVITVDEYGSYYVVFMRIEDASLPLTQRTTHLDLYRSTDDGLTWQFVGRTYSDIYPDYPQLVSKGNGQLFLVFGNFIDFLKQHIMFMKSADGGATWSNPVIFTYPSAQQTYIGVPDISWGPDSTLQIGFGSSSYKGPCYTESKDLGVNWSGYLFADQHTTTANSSVLSKFIANPAVDFYGILSHRPHNNSTPISYHYKVGNKLGTTIVGEGAYGEGILTSDSIVHLVYNELEKDTFRIKYVASGNQGITFTAPIVLYSAPFEGGEFGEYQSLVLGNDQHFYLTFCDWADSSMAKTLVFEPLTIDFNPILNTSDEKRGVENNWSIYPNPFNGVTTIACPNHSSVIEILISTKDGKIAMVLHPDSNQHKMELDLSGFPNGMYIVRIKEKKRYIIRKIVKVN
jgi:hypothetical protein